MNAKPWYQSTTYYALAVAIATKIFMLAGLAEGDAGKQAGELVTVMLPFIGIVADLVAAWGRKRAQGPVTLTKAAAEAQSKQAGVARISMLLVISVLAACMLVGCSGTKQLYRQASTPVQYAKAALLHHNALGEQVVALRADPLVSARGKARLLDGYRLTVCSQDERTRAVITGDCMHGPAQRVEAAARAYESLSTAQTEAELQAAVDTLVGELVKLINAVNEAK